MQLVPQFLHACVGSLLAMLMTSHRTLSNTLLHINGNACLINIYKQIIPFPM